MADRDAAGLNGAIQRLAQVHAVEDGDAVEVDALGRAGDADERARKRAELDRPHAAVLPALRPRVDLVAGPIARGEELRAQVHPQPVERQQPVEVVAAVGRSLAVVLPKPDEVFLDVEQQPRRPHAHPHVGRRRDGEREVLLRILIRRLVEHVVVDAEVRELDARIHRDRPDAHPIRRRSLRFVRDRLGRRRRREGRRSRENGGAHEFISHRSTFRDIGSAMTGLVRGGVRARIVAIRARLHEEPEVES